ncbi:hypothetical protein ES703_52014 [subsurface metagenome]
MPKKVAIDINTEDQLDFLPQVVRMVEKAGLKAIVLSAEDILNGELFNYDILLEPGGMGGFYGLRQYEAFNDAVRYFVANGGGYMGICAGAYVAGLRMTPFLYSYCPRTLGLIDAKIISPPFIRYISEYQEAAGERVSVTCKITDEPHPIVTPNEGQVIDIVYSAGPLIRELGPDVTPLLTYVDGIMTPGDVALCCSVFGKGRVVICSPHPETPWGEDLVNGGCQEWLYLNMISWVSQPEEKVYFPFPPWELGKRFLPYPAAPAAFIFGLGVLATLGLVQIAKKRP